MIPLQISNRFFDTGTNIKKFTKSLKVSSEDFDWFEHSDVSVTQYYTRDTNRYYKIAPFDWIKAVLKSQKILGEENSLKSENSEIDLLQIEVSPVKENKPPWVHFYQQEGFI